MSARFANINREAEARFQDLLATGQPLEVLELKLAQELTTLNLRANAGQICKGVLMRIQRARMVQHVAESHLLTSKNSQSLDPEPEPRVTRNAVSKVVDWKKSLPPQPTRIVKFRIKNGYFTPKVVPIPDTRENQSQTPRPANVVWSIYKKDQYVCEILDAEAPTVMSPTTLEYVGTNLTDDQRYYNGLARRAGTKEIIEARIKLGLEELGEVLEEATRRAHSLAECAVSRLTGDFVAQEGE